jgi:pimeloyl-ACP methyl ester carboxylesterase
VLLHAFPLDPTMWEPQMEALRGHDISTPTLYGLGLSVDGWAEALTDRDAQRVCVVGASMGGYAALALARRLGERAAAVMVVGSYADADGEARLRWREEVAAAAERNGAEGVWDAMRPTLFSAGADPAVVARARAASLGQDPTGLATAMLALRSRPDARAAARALQCPLVVGVGADDPAVTVAEAASLAREARRGRHVVFERSGHLPNLERQHRFNQVLAEMLEDCGA